jgi:hypothetical protein
MFEGWQRFFVLISSEINTQQEMKRYKPSVPLFFLLDHLA